MVAGDTQRDKSLWLSSARLEVQFLCFQLRAVCDVFL